MSITYNLAKNYAPIWILTGFMVLSFSYFSKSGDEEHYYKDSRQEPNEFYIRDGFQNFFRKTNENDTIAIAYLGGSITAAPGWRALSFDYFQKQYPDRIFKEVNAVIGGTGSEFGAYRLASHVLKFKPDLVFVEFAVNDTHGTNEGIIRSMEGIIRQIWADNPETDICFIYTIRASFIPGYLKGQLPLPVVAMEEVASTYGIPSIYFGWEVTKSLKDSTLIYKGDKETQDGIPVFSKDGVHPYLKTGHPIYHQILERSFEHALEQHKPTYNNVVHKLPSPMDQDHLFDAKLINLNQITTSGGWNFYDSVTNDVAFKFRRYLPGVAKSSFSGDFITLKFKGNSVGILDIMGPGTGRVIIEIDHVVTDTISRFDKYCTYYRTNYFLERNLKDAVHEVKFTALAAPFDKGKILSERENTMDDPKDFEEYAWYLGQVLIDGELID